MTVHVSGLKKEEVEIDLFDIQTYLDDRGVYYVHSGKNVSAGWIGLNCPFCRDRSNHFGVNLQTNLISCWKCGRKGSIVNLIMAIDGCSYRRACAIVPQFTLREFNHLTKPKRVHADKTMFPSGTSETLLDIHKKFLVKRGYDPEIIQRKYDILGVGPTLDDWKFRIIIPVYMNNELVTYVARDTTGNQEVKSKNCPIERCKLQAKHCLYGIDEVGHTALIVEGAMDKWRMGDGAVATFGTKYTTEQLLLLKGKKRAFIMFDGREDDDGDAIAQAHKMAHDLYGIVKEVEVLELDSGDPDNLTEDEVWEIRRDIGL